MAGYKQWAVGEEVLAADFNAKVAGQVVARFTTEAQRSTQLTTPEVGQLSIITTDPRLIWTFDGTAWVPVRGQTRAGHYAGVSDGPTASITIIHNLGAVPAAVMVMPTFPTALNWIPQYSVGNKTATTFQAVLINTVNGAPIGGNPCDFDWFVTT